MVKAFRDNEQVAGKLRGNGGIARALCPIFIKNRHYHGIAYCAIRMFYVCKCRERGQISSCGGVTR